MEIRMGCFRRDNNGVINCVLFTHWCVSERWQRQNMVRRETTCLLEWEIPAEQLKESVAPWNMVLAGSVETEWMRIWRAPAESARSGTVVLSGGG